MEGNREEEENKFQQKRKEVEDEQDDEEEFEDNEEEIMELERQNKEAEAYICKKNVIECVEELKELEDQEDQENDFKTQILQEVFDCQKEIPLFELEDQYKKSLLRAISLTHAIIEQAQSLIMKFACFQDRTTTLSKLIKSHTILNIQIVMICEYIQYQAHKQNFKYIYEKYSNLGNYRILDRKYEFFNFKEIKNSMEIIEKKCLLNIHSACEVLENVDITIKQIVKQSFNTLQISNSQLNTIIEIIPYAVTFSQTDLFSLNKSDEQWQELYKNSNIKEILNQETMEKAYSLIIRGILSANAMVHKQNESKNSFMKSFYDKFGVFSYFFANKRAKQRSELFFAEANSEDAISVWNYMESGATQQGIRFAFPSIKYCQQIYIDRCAPIISKEFILDELKNKTINLKNQQPLSLGKISLAVDGGDEDAYYQNLFVESKTKICIRILCSKELERPTEPGQIPSGIFSKIFSSQPKPIFEKIIIHIHGGGFVAMSSRTHQTYTRKWANQINVPIFSIDYRKAPQFPYPCGLDDVWQSYNWIIKFVQKFFNVTPKKIVLVGDSAGGNLVAALTLMCIQFGVRKPDGILLVYPALNLNIAQYTPSMLIALDDFILPHTFLKICLYSYINFQEGFQPDKDPFLSPILASDELIKQLPPTRMLVGTNDPLHDECWRFLQKLQNNQIDMQMTIYKYLGHGFLNFDSPAMKEVRVCNQDAVKYLKDLLQMN